MSSSLVGVNLGQFTKHFPGLVDIFDGFGGNRIVLGDGDGYVRVDLEADRDHLAILPRNCEAGEGVENFEGTNGGSSVSCEPVSGITGVVRKKRDTVVGAILCPIVMLPTAASRSGDMGISGEIPMDGGEEENSM